MTLHAEHHALGAWSFSAEASGDAELLLCDNETNFARLWGGENMGASTKDAIGDAVVRADRSGLLPGDATATKAAVHYRWRLEPGEVRMVHVRLRRGESRSPTDDADDTFERRRSEANAFHAALTQGLAAEAARIHRQALAGLVWTRQFYHFDVGEWLDGDPAGPPPPEQRRGGRNHRWRELNTDDVLSMPDSWEYPWFAAWDVAFHAVAMARLDPEYAKTQLVLLTREWYMHPNGQLPAYEWNFSDVNPPVHAWAARRVYEVERHETGRGDRSFLERVFHKLLLNFTWWVNREDAGGHNVFQGGFLGLDNIGVFNRAEALPAGGRLAQADGTAWMGMYCLEMLSIALELARENRVYEDVATKFFEHFLYIAAALNDIGGEGVEMWDDEDGFFYDVLRLPDGHAIPLKVRSMVGLIPLTAVATLEAEQLDRFPAFAERLDWFLRNRPDLARLVAPWEKHGAGERRLLALVHGDRLRRVLSRLFDPDEFLSEHGFRSLSKYHAEHPYRLSIDGSERSVGYEPADSQSGLFGGNSNWRGPVWFPLNYLIVESLRRFHGYYGDTFRVDLPQGDASGGVSLAGAADNLARRLVGIFLPGADGRRPVWGGREPFASDPAWGADPWFHEYFHGDTGAGLGASHQTGWTALVAALIAGVDHTPER
ncbi:MAG TPA: glucosidase [Candidatus Limnocylindria bacterium]|nr:glucosidase [Candidatus Limnocylindria bacterium]